LQTGLTAAHFITILLPPLKIYRRRKSNMALSGEWITVAATLIHQAIGKRLMDFVDNGVCDEFGTGTEPAG
jgi:hypothetical protein